MVQLMEGQVMSREVLSKKALETWYFEYCEAEREFLDAQRSCGVKKRDACLFLFSAYAKWSLSKFGEVLRPEQMEGECEIENPLAIFFDEFKIDSSLRNLLARLLNQGYDERFGGTCNGS
jgi:hypothetical protein